MSDNADKDESIIVCLFVASCLSWRWLFIGIIYSSYADNILITDRDWKCTYADQWKPSFPQVGSRFKFVTDYNRTEIQLKNRPV